MVLTWLCLLVILSGTAEAQKRGDFRPLTEAEEAGLLDLWRKKAQKESPVEIKNCTTDGCPTAVLTRRAWSSPHLCEEAKAEVWAKDVCPSNTRGKRRKRQNASSPCYNLNWCPSYCSNSANLEYWPVCCLHPVTYKDMPACDWLTYI